MLSKGVAQKVECIMVKVSPNGRLMSSAEFHQAAYCYATLHTGEKVEYDLATRDVKMMRGNGGMTDVPMVKIRKRGDRTDSGGWYRMNALTYVMPDGTTRR